MQRFSGDRRALVDDEEVAAAEERWEVLEPSVVMPVRPRDQEANVVPGPAADLGRFVGEDPFGALEDQLGRLHAGTSHTAACAW